MKYFQLFLLVWGALSLIGFLAFCVLFGRATILFISEEFVPIWRAWYRKRKEAIRNWWALRGGTVNGVALILMVLLGLYVGLIITAP